MVSLVDSIDSREELLFGLSYLRGFFIFVPRFLWPDRPLDLSEEYARNTISRWQPGQGMGFSLMAEAFLNFWWLGPVLQYLMIGYLWGKSWAWLRRRFSPVEPAYWQTLYGTFGFYLLILMHRGPVAGLIKQAFQVFVVLIVMRVLFDRQSTGRRVTT